MTFNGRLENSFVGEWWKPGSGDARALGTLEIGSGLELNLYESAIPGQGMTNQFESDIQIMHGMSMGTCVTMLDCVHTWISSDASPLHQGARRRFDAKVAFVGERHIQSVDDCRFDRASFRLGNLDAWVNRSPYSHPQLGTESTIQVELQSGSDAHSELFSIGVIGMPELQAVVPGCEILLRRVVTTRTGRNDSGFTSYEEIELRLAERLALDELEYLYIRPLQQLLTLATKVDCKVFELRVGVSEMATGNPGDMWPYSSYSVRRTSSDLSDHSQSRIREGMRFGMNSPDQPPNIEFGSLVPRWFQMQEALSAVCDVIFSVRSDAAGYLQQQMFSIASSIEGLHRALNPQLETKTEEERSRNRRILQEIKKELPEDHQWLANAIRYSHRKSFIFRVRELLSATDHVMEAVVGNEEGWAQHLRDTRDGIGHVLGSSDAEVRKMQAMLQSAQLLAEVALLRELGLTDEECQLGLKNSWERENLRAVVSESFPQWFQNDVR